MSTLSRGSRRSVSDFVGVNFSLGAGRIGCCELRRRGMDESSSSGILACNR